MILSRFCPDKNEKTSEGLEIPCAAAGVLARKRHCCAIPFFLHAFILVPASGHRIPAHKKRQRYALPFFLAESEGFEPPEPRRVQQISSLPRSTTPATFRCKNTTFFACLRSFSEIFTRC